MKWRTWQDPDGVEHLRLEMHTYTQGLHYQTVCWKDAGAIFSEVRAPTCLFCVAAAGVAEKYRGR